MLWPPFNCQHTITVKSKLQVCMNFLRKDQSVVFHIVVIIGTLYASLRTSTAVQDIINNLERGKLIIAVWCVAKQLSTWSRLSWVFCDTNCLWPWWPHLALATNLLLLSLHFASNYLVWAHRSKPHIALNILHPLLSTVSNALWHSPPLLHSPWMIHKLTLRSLLKKTTLR